MSRQRVVIPEGVKPERNMGFEAPKSDIISKPYTVGGCFAGRNDRSRYWVPILVEDKEVMHRWVFEASVLMGLEHSPVNGKREVDESMLITWMAESKEPSFQKPV